MNILTVKESTSEKYTPRTYYNAKSADLTVAFATDLTTAGELCTHKAAGDKYLGILLKEDSDSLSIAQQLITALKEHNATKLNIAGNGIYTLTKNGCDQNFINYFIYNVIAEAHATHKIHKIFTGGQTGVDMAGAVAGYLLQIPTEVTLPKGYIQRFENKKDVSMTHDNIVQQIKSGADFIINNYNNKSKIKP